MPSRSYTAWPYSSPTSIAKLPAICPPVPGPSASLRSDASSLRKSQALPEQEGLLDYQRTLPVPRSAILLADAAVWSLAALPGIAVGMLAAAFRFGVDIQVDALTVAAVLGAQFTMVSIGYAIAFWLPLNATSLVTQIIMIGGLLFTPITFPAERLPEWAVTMHQFLPFAPIGNLIREATFRAGDPQLLNLVAAVSWAVAAYTVAYLALRKRS